MIELLDTMEGYFWKLIRGQGLAYSCFLDANAEAGLLTFTIYQSPDAFKAFEQAKIVIDQLINKEVRNRYSWLDQTLIAFSLSL
jgi:Zn-dependent M16 (insulinase) family peptidase